MVGLEQVLNEVIDNCKNCQKRITYTGKTKEPIRKYSEPQVFESIFVDFCGPFKPTLHGKKYIFAIIDEKSKYIILHAVPSQEEKTATTLLENNWFHRE